MARRTKREVVSDKCFACIHDCKQQQPIEYCENFEQGHTRKEYAAMIREQNVDLKKLCDKKRLSYNFMMKMLEGRIHFKFKYRAALNSRLFEKEEYLPYIDKFEKEGEQTG